MDTDYFSQLFASIQIITPTFGNMVALVLAFIFLGFSGFVSASEIAFFSLTPDNRAEIDNENHHNDSIIKRLLERSDYLLATILIANNFVNVSVVMLCNYFISNVFYFGDSPILQFITQTVILTFLLLLFGEIMPKIYATHNSLKFARTSASTLNILRKAFYPLAHFLVKSTQFVNKRITKHSSNISINELSQALEITDVDAKEEKDLLEGIIKFGAKTVEEVMTPRVDITAIDIHTDYPDLLNLITKTGYSRIPVYDGTEDNIQGIIYIKDLLLYLNAGSGFEWQKLLRAAYYVPENKMIDNLLEEFRTNKNHIAIVVDEFGGTSGIVTLEDILEEIIGEISDEYDEEERQFIKLDDNTYIFEGKTLLNDFYKIDGVVEDDFEKIAEEPETLAGLILEIKEGFPVPKEKIHFGRYLFSVLEMDKRRIIKVKVKIETEKNA